MKSMKQNIVEAKTALESKPMLSTTVERVMILNELRGKDADLPHPLRFSKWMSILLSRVSTPLEPYDLIAGRTVDRVLTEEEEQIFQSFIHDPEYVHRTVLFSSGHCTYSWAMVAKEGIAGLRARAEERMTRAENEDQRIFLQGILEIYDAIAGDPCYYLAYHGGYIEILELRSIAETTLGDKFNLKEFHKFFLDLGECPFSLANQRLADWMELQPSAAASR